MHMAAVDLAPPTIAHFDLTVPGRSSVADNEMIGEPVLHVAHMAMVIVERARVALSRAAVVHDNHLPARIATIGRRAIDLGPDRSGEITKAGAAAAASSVAAEKPREKTSRLLVAVFLDR